MSETCLTAAKNAQNAAKCLENTLERKKMAKTCQNCAKNSHFLAEIAKKCHIFGRLRRPPIPPDPPWSKFRQGGLALRWGSIPPNPPCQHV